MCEGDNSIEDNNGKMREWENSWCVFVRVGWKDKKW